MDRMSEGPRTHDLLSRGRNIVELDGSNAVELHDGPLEDDGELTAKRVDVRLEQIGDGLDAAGAQLRADAPSDAQTSSTVVASKLVCN